ncbi:MAG: hypothetical protein ACK5YR_13765 [Pirellula sp.]
MQNTRSPWDTSVGTWIAMFVIAPAGGYVGQLLKFKEFLPRQKLGSFNLDRVMEAVTAGSKQ